MRLPEEQHVVAAMDAAIQREPAAVVDAVGSFLSRARELGISTLTGVGLPLRPIVLSRARLHRIARDLHAVAERARARLLRDHQAGVDLTAAWGIPAPFVEATDFAASLASPWALATVRPDGFLFDDGFRAAELNAVNGVLISTTYASAVHLLHSEHLSILERAGLPRDGLVRSFDGLAAVLRAAAGAPRPRVAVMLPGPDCLNAADWGERVQQQLSWAPRLLADAGFEVAVVDETELHVGDDGVARTGDDRRVDVVYLATTGLGLFDRPERLVDGDLRAFRGPRVGQAPFVMPLAGLALEKGILPSISGEPPPSDDVRIQHTERPTRERLAEYRLHKDRWVVKRGFRDKHTFVGIAEPGRRWNWVLEQVLDGRAHEYVMQEYASLPKTTLPVLVDEKHVEWIEVRVELSPFVFGGEPWGAMVRYAPDAEGLVLSPPPEQMGFGIVYEA